MKRTIALSLVLLVTCVPVSANLGSVTAGSITGVNISGVNIEGSAIEAGDDTVLIDEDGITIDDGAAAVNGINWTGGGQVRGLGGSLFLSAPNGLSIDSPVFTDTINMHTDEDIILNGAGATLSNPAWGGAGDRFLCVDNNGVVYPQNSAC